MNISNKKYILSLTGVISLFLAFAPVLDPYIITEIGSGITIRVNDIFAILFGGLAFAKSARFEAKYGFLIYWCIGMAVFSLFGLAGTEGTSALIAYKNICIWLIYAFLMMYLWKYGDREKFFVWAEKIAFICCIIVLIQFFGGNLGISIWDGRIPGLSLSKYDGWSGYIDPNTGEIRPCGIFQEASYVGIYFLVIYVYLLSKGRVFKAAILAATIVLTTSMVGILGCAIVTLYLLLFTNQYIVEKKAKHKIIIIIIISIIAIFYLINKNDYAYAIWIYILRRLFNFSSDLQGIRMGSTKWRVLGNGYLFVNYNYWQKLFGFGAQQYASYFGVVNYSNNFINILMNFGVLGLFIFGIAMFKLYKMIDKENRIYYIVVLLIFAVDQQWFNWYFFYVLSACVLNKNEVTEQV